MPTDHLKARPASLFLFAHQDDEFGIFQQIETYVRAGHSLFCVYATDGSATADAARRDRESLAVLGTMGIPAGNVFFAGREFGIRDGGLHEKVVELSRWLDGFLDAHPEIRLSFVPAWEGGHPDHDLLHAIAVRVMHARCRLDGVRQFPLYNAYNCPAPFFRVLSPLYENGPVEMHRFAWPDRLRYLSYCLSYPSQWRTWIGLFPFVFLRYLFCGVQSLQHVASARLLERPHAGRLYYERRGFLSWQQMKAALDSLPLMKKEA